MTGPTPKKCSRPTPAAKSVRVDASKVVVLQSQLSLERKQKQNYIISCTKTNQELSDLHQELVNSLAVVARKPEATVLESETRGLDETLNNSFTFGTVGSDRVLSGKHLPSSTPKVFIRSPQEQINQLKKQKLQETTFGILGQLKIFFKRQQEEIESLKEQYEKNTEENVRLIKGLQAELQQAKQALKNGEWQIKYLKNNLQQVQQQEAQTKFILDKLHLTRSSLHDKEKEIKSLQTRIKELSKQKEEVQHTVLSLQQDLDTINRLYAEKEEELAKSKVIKEKDQCLQWQKEKIEHLENEKIINRQELNHMIAVLKQTESGEIEWKQKAQRLDLTLARSEEAMRILKEEMAVTQSMVSERDVDRFHLQEQLDTAFKSLKESRFIIETVVGVSDLLCSENDIPGVQHNEAGKALKKEGQLTWMAEKRLLYKLLQLLQQAVARLENDKYGLE
ncbi:centrosome-associated protein CEP250-like [Thamnophis elegans]|uniref:centrosome-associated protein CEP250-like n=1 Tax=Thamnophis elegans TaxID=35005 RepID=UPI001376F96C|nr:centrosome-associated protein CEP250-like [Thamnophis elegans]